MQIKDGVTGRIYTLVLKQKDKECLRENGLFLKPGTECKKYYRCCNGKAKVEACYGDLVFDPFKEKCEWSDLYTCIETPERKECPRRNGQFLKRWTNCKKYFKCSNGEPEEQQCPKDTLFNPATEKCESAELYTCIEKPERKECLERNGKFLKPGTNCMKYYECSNGEPEERKCLIGTLFNPSTSNCEMVEIYTCIETPDKNKCVRRNGKFLKPGTNCKEYYKCSDGRFKSKKCERNMLFNPSSEKCESSKFYTCIESLSTTEKVSSTVTSVETSTSLSKTSTDPAISSSTLQKSTTRKISTSRSTTEISTSIEPNEISSASDVPTITEISTSQPTSTEISTSQPTTTEISTLQPIITEISTSQPTSTEISTSQPTTTAISTSQSTIKEISSSQPTSTEISTSQPTTTEISTLQPTIPEISTFQPTSTEISTSQPTTTRISTMAEISTSQPASESSTSRPTTSETSIISEMTSPQVSSTHSTEQTIVKEDKEGELTEPTIFETTKEVTISPSTVEVTTSAEVNIMCPEPDGYFPHPTDKHKFVGCVGNVANVLTCPSDLVYRHHLRRCDHE
ncbi:unnamed protein product [Larinioides sclopetarius]|uniref:Chitin-binding type-2 domain-containing protein n=1 Tax=Larinioides sclopetarius TaxID=280406 RepID=A0AAV1ZVS1_9ARAC